MRRRWRALGALALALGVGALPSLGGTVSGPDWNGALQRYAEDPFRNRRALLALRAEVGPDTPPFYALAVADAQLRAKRFGAARRVFDEALGRGLEEPWATWARLGLGWTALAADDVDAARIEFAQVASGAGRLAAVGSYAVVLIDAADGRPGVDERFRALASDPAAGPQVRGAARMGAAYARYWAADYAGARAAFEVLAAARDVPGLQDDARYAAAWAQARAGDVAGARRALAALAGRRASGRRASRTLVNLEPRALVQAGARRYREGPLRIPEDQVATMADGDGVALAHAALVWIDTGTFAPRAPLAVWRALDDAVPRATPIRATPRAGSPEESAGTGGAPWWLVLALSALALVVAWVYTRRRTTAERGRFR